MPEVLALTTRETFADLPDASAPWLERYELVLRRIADTLSNRTRCVGLHLAYGINDETPEAADAVRAFFREQRDGIAQILMPAFAKDTAHAMATDALTRLEGATLWAVIDSDTRPMQRAVDTLLAEAKARGKS